MGCMGLIEQAMPYATARLFIQPNISVSVQTAKANLQNLRTGVAFMVDRVISGLIQMFQQLTWMDPYSKRLAVQKANGIIHNIAYPGSDLLYNTVNSFNTKLINLSIQQFKMN